jgi:hypothetical protein
MLDAHCALNNLKVDILIAASMGGGHCARNDVKKPKCLQEMLSDLWAIRHMAIMQGFLCKPCFKCVQLPKSFRANVFDARKYFRIQPKILHLAANRRASNSLSSQT